MIILDLVRWWEKKEKKSYDYKVLPIKGGKNDQAMNQISSSSGAL